MKRDPRAGVVGIDFDTKSIHLVRLPWHSDEAQWYPIDLMPMNGEDKGSFYAARRVVARLAHFDWEPVALVYIERPYSQNRGTVAALMRVQGAIIAALPESVIASEIPPQDWKREFVGVANASKELVRERARAFGFGADQPEDACDALGVAYAARAESQRAQTREAA